MEYRDEYKFLQIRDAIASINQKVSLIGAILEFGLPKKTRGTDWCCTLKIIDESYPKPGLSVNVFASSMEELPRISSLGDIIQLSRVVMKIHHGEVNAVFNKAFSSFALYEGKDKDGPNFLPYQHSLKYHPPNFLPYQHSLKYHPRGRDSKFIAGLRKWFTDLCLDEGPTSFTFLREMKEGERAHLLCKVLHVSEVSKQVWMAFVWDGTDCPPINIDSNFVIAC